MSRTQGLVLISIACALAAAEPAAPAQRSSPPLTPVKASYIISASAVPLFVGIQAGFYAAEGLDVQPQVVTAGAAAVAGVASGQLQFATGTVLTLMQAYSQGIPIELIGPEVSTAKGSDCLLTRTGTTLGQVHTIAINSIAGSTELTNEIWMKRRGIAVGALHYVAIPFAGQLTAVQNGTVDAADIAQPFLAQALTQGGFACLGDDAIEAGPYGSAAAFWFTSQSYAQQNPEIVKAFATALIKSNVYSATHQGAEEAADTTITGVTLAQAKLTQFYGYPTAANLGVLQRFADLGYQLGFITTQLSVKSMFWSGVRFTSI